MTEETQPSLYVELAHLLGGALIIGAILMLLLGLVGQGLMSAFLGIAALRNSKETSFAYTIPTKVLRLSIAQTKIAYTTCYIIVCLTWVYVTFFA